MKKLRDFEAELGPDVCLRAIEEAVNAGKRSWSYLAAILLRKQEQDIHSLEDWDRAEAQRMARKPAQEENGHGFRGPVDLGDLDNLIAAGEVPGVERGS